MLASLLVWLVCAVLAASGGFLFLAVRCTPTPCDYLPDIELAAERADWLEVAEQVRKARSTCPTGDSGAPAALEECKCEAEVLLYATVAELYKGNIVDAERLWQEAEANKNQFSGLVAIRGQYVKGLIRFVTGNYLLAQEWFGTVLKNEDVLPSALLFDTLYDDTRLKIQMGNTEAYAQNAVRLMVASQCDPSRQLRVSILQAVALMHRGAVGQAAEVLSDIKVAQLDPMRRAIRDATLARALGNDPQASYYRERALQWFKANGDVWHELEARQGRISRYLNEGSPDLAAAELVELRTRFLPEYDANSCDLGSQLGGFICRVAALDIAVTELEVPGANNGDKAALEARIRKALQDTTDAQIPLYQIRCHDLLIRLANLGHAVPDIALQLTMAIDAARAAGLWGEQARLLLLKAEWCSTVDDAPCRDDAVRAAEAIYYRLGNHDKVGELREFRRKQGISD